jgi:hypothetical protein
MLREAPAARPATSGPSGDLCREALQRRQRVLSRLRD